jgi:hypothetical protein
LVELKIEERRVAKEERGQPDEEEEVERSLAQLCRNNNY